MNTKKFSVGWIGTGVMGLPMAGHLLDAGYLTTVMSRTPAKCAALEARGARRVDTAAAVVAASDVVFTMVGWPQDVEKIYFGSQGLFESVRSGQILIDMTTTRPSLAQRIALQASQLGATALDAPVSGGDVGASNGTLSIMIGGDGGAVEAVWPLFEILGNTLVHQGEAGSGQHTKMCNQITIAGTMVGVCESLLYGTKAGLDLETMLESISGGAAACWTLDNLAPRILKRDFEAGFFVEHFIKDMEIALDEARRMNLPLPGLALVNQLYRSLSAQGGARKGTQALYTALESLAGVPD